MSRVLSYILIVTGGFVAIYAQAGEEQNQIILISGIAILMFGLYSIARNIPSKTKSDEEQNDQQS